MANAFIRDNTAGRGAMDTVCIPYNNPEVFYRAMATCEDFPNFYLFSGQISERG